MDSALSHVTFCEQLRGKHKDRAYFLTVLHMVDDHNERGVKDAWVH